LGLYWLWDGLEMALGWVQMGFEWVSNGFQMGLAVGDLADSCGKMGSFGGYALCVMRRG
jgi:hypothetical protein